MNQHIYYVFISSQIDAIAAYNDWYQQSIAAKPVEGDIEPRTWAEVKLEDVEKEEMFIQGKIAQ